MDFIELKKELINILVTTKNNNNIPKLNNYLLQLDTIINEMRKK
jgi:hypothetical protein